MNRLFTIAVLLGGAVRMQASPILVDNMATNQFFGVGPGGSNPLSGSNGLFTGVNSIGGARSVVLTRTSGGSFNFVNVAGGIAEVNSAAGDTATALFIWDGDADDSVNASGLAGVDLTGGGSNLFLYIATRSDLAGAPVTVTVYSDAGNASSVTFLTPGGGFLVPFTSNFLNFNSFSATLGSGADFTNVGAITLLVDGTGAPGLDTQIDLIETTANPEPATFALLGVGLAITGIYGRKRFRS